MEKSQRVICIGKALTEGIIKGSFTDNRHIFNFAPVENIDSKGNKSIWEISVIAYDTDTHQTIPISPRLYTCPILAQPPSNIVAKIITKIRKHTSHIQINDETVITKGKNIGKANATTPISQAFSEAYRKWVNKNKNANKEQISNNIRPFPMLLKKYGITKKATFDEADYEKGIIVQPKLDGIRTIAHMLSDQTIEFYSRKGHAYIGLDHIASEVCEILINQKKYKITDINLDGEIYIPHTPLQEISGAIRGEDNTLKEKLEFYIFDCFISGYEDLTQETRLKIIQKMYDTKTSLKYVKLVPNTLIHSQEELDQIYNKYIGEGYEGIVARRTTAIYKFGVGSQRSSDVLKMKPFSDDEFEIVSYKDGRGREKGAITYILKTDKNYEFAAVPNAPLEERKKTFEKYQKNKDLFNNEIKGKMATIKYADLSNKGIPLQPKMLYIRDDI